MTALTTLPEISTGASATLVPAPDAGPGGASVLRRVPGREWALLLGFGLVALAVAGPHRPAQAHCRSEPAPLTFGADTAVAMTVKAGSRCAVKARTGTAAISHFEIDSQPAHGRLLRRGRSGVTYHAVSGYRGEDSFSFALSGSSPGAQGIAVIRVRVTVR